jgi:DNA-binding winged helix-turn-helix (wHTH) protein/TolB-like protein/Tfp pilus assembly protein PilF
MNVSSDQVFRFGSFVLDIAEQRLLRDGQAVPLSPKPFDLLVLLLRHPDHVLDKAELMSALWPDCSVEEANLTVTVSALRKALGPAGVSFIQTVPKRGYRFAGRVEPEAPPSSDQTSAASSVAVSDALTDNAPHGLLRPGNRSLRSGRFFLTRVALPALVVAAAAILVLFRPFSAAADRPMTTAVAVLPFHALEGQAKEPDLGVAMADALITKLSNIHEIVVRPTGEVARYVNFGGDLLTVGRELSVDAVVDGTIQRSGDRMRVTVQLVSVPKGASLWATTFDENATNIFSLQDSISERVADALVPSLTRQERLLLAKRFTDNADAYDAYQRGRYDLNQRTPESLKRAVDHFNRAITIDSSFARAYVALADCHNLLADYQAVQPKAAAPLARAAAIKALQLDPNLAEAHASLAFVRFHFDWDWIEAEREFKRAITLNQNYATAHHWYGLFLATMGRFDEAFSELGRARDLDPSSLIVATNIGWVQYLTHQYDQALDQYQKVLTIEPDFAPAHYKLTWVMEQKGRYDEASATLARGLELSGNAGLAATVRRTYATAGYAEQLKRFRASRIEESERGYVDPYNMATLSAELDNLEQTLQWLEASYRDRSYWLPYIGVEPAFDGTRKDARFSDLLRRVGLPRMPSSSTTSVSTPVALKQ